MAVGVWMRPRFVPPPLAPNSGDATAQPRTHLVACGRINVTKARTFSQPFKLRTQIGDNILHNCTVSIFNLSTN